MSELYIAVYIWTMFVTTDGSRVDITERTVGSDEKKYIYKVFYDVCDLCVGEYHFFGCRIDDFRIAVF